MLISMLLLVALQDSLDNKPERNVTPPKLLSSEPVIIPPEFCMFANPETTCAASTSFNVLPDGKVSNIKINLSSRIWACDRAVIRSLRSRIYESSGGFDVRNEVVQSQTCRTPHGR